MFRNHFCALKHNGKLFAQILFFSLLLAGCGGGGGGGGSSPATPPYIVASVISFSTTTIPPGLIPAGSPAGSNTGVSVSVQNNSSGAPITNATVSVNGIALSYVATYEDYEGGIVVAPGGSISLSVAVDGTTYTASGKQFSAYPTITSPMASASWSSLTSNLIAWSGAVPTTTSLYALGVLDTNGNLIWPSGNAIQTLPNTTTSYTLAANSLTAGNRFVIVGLADLVGITNAATNSGIVIGGFNYSPITVTSTPPAAPLASIAITPNNPVVTNGKTKQLTATGTYTDTSTKDLTSQVTWATSDTSKATVSTTGLVTGISYGSATVTATYSTIIGSTPVNIFQPTLSPSPPLSQSVAYQIDYAHSGTVVFPNPIVYPSGPAWSITLNGPASYPLIAGGKVFVATASTMGGSALYALNEQTGSIVWGPIATSGTSWTSHAYDQGKIFVIDNNGKLQSFDASTGLVGWSTQLPGQYFFTSPPTAVNGIVYVGGAGSAGTLYAVDESNGSILWTAGVWNGDHSSPAVSGDGIFVSYPCQVYKFDPVTGSPLWHYSGPCEGGGGKTPSYANGKLFVRDPIEGGGEVFDASIGTKVGTYTATPIPAVMTQTGFFMSAGTLKGIDLTTNNVLWSFVGDGSLVSAPIAINQTVFEGSSAGNVYAIDAATGTQMWSGFAGSGINGPDEQNAIPLTGFCAGEGYLVVPAGSVLTAWKLF